MNTLCPSYWLLLERRSRKIWKMVYCIPQVSPMDGILSIRKNPSRYSEDTTNEASNSMSWFNNSKSTSISFMSTKKKWPQAIGRSKWWLTTKIHGLVASLYDIVGFTLTPWNTSDTPLWLTMIQTLLPENEYLPLSNQIQYFLADRAYDTNDIREALIERDIQAVIPPKKNRVDKTITYDEVLYKERNIIERNWLFLKHFRRIFTRYDKLDTNYAWFLLLWYIVQILRKI